jgi:hypothetical protein
MHKMHKKSVQYGHMKAVQNTFLNIFEIFVAYFEQIYYNGKDFSSIDFNIKVSQGQKFKK